MASSNYSALSLFLNRLLQRSALPAEEQRAILGMRSHASQARAHSDVVSPGDEVTHACLVVDGIAARFDHLEDGRRQFTAFYVPGDMCDLHSVVLPTASWGIEALTTSTVLRIPHGELQRVAFAYPAVALAFWRDTTVDACILAKWVTNVGRKDALSRLAHLLCETGIRMEYAGIGVRACFPMDVTQAQLADALGLTPVHVNRTLQTLRRSGLVSVAGRTVTIHDWGALAAHGEFCADFLQLNGAAERHAPAEALEPA